MSERPIPKHIRRSVFCLSANDPQIGAKAYAAWADAIVLDYTRPAGRNWQDDLRSRMPEVIYGASRGAGEVFIRLDAAIARAAVDSVVFPGLKGIVVKGANTAEDVGRLSERLDTLEAERGLEPGTLEIDVELATAAGIWNALGIARASARFGTFTIDERALSANLGMSLEAASDFEPLEYVKSEIITVATSAGGQAQGMSHPLSLSHENVGDAVLAKAVRRARDTGFKGALCPHISWIKACNEGFRPSPEETAFYVRVREVFAEGLKRGMASVPLDGKMVDVPVDVRARLYLDWANRAQARDEEKARAHE